MKFNSERLSNFEALRLLSIFLIVFYHFLRWLVQDNSGFDWVRALWIPFHVGVICFVLISGYFRIRPSSRGLLMLLGILFVYSIPDIVRGVMHAESGYDILHSFQFVSHSWYWFVIVYLELYLISPLLNTYFDHASIRGQWYLFGVLALIAIYFGWFSKETSFAEGKNLVNFMLIYQTGHLLKEYSSRWKALDWKLLVGSYLGLNVFLVVSFMLTRGGWLGSIIWKLSFPYNSPLLLLNASLLFILFGKMEFHSRSVNRLAKHSFAIYLIHGMAILAVSVERPFVNAVFHHTGNNVFLTVPLLFVLACLIMFGCIAVDSLLNPVWKWVDRQGGIIQERLGF